MGTRVGSADIKSGLYQEIRGEPSAVYRVLRHFVGGKLGLDPAYNLAEALR